MPTQTVSPHSPETPSVEPLPAAWSKRRIGILGTGVLGALGFSIWFLSAPSTPAEPQRQQDALALLENGSPADLRLARQLALELQAAGYPDSEFPGAAE